MKKCTTCNQEKTINDFHKDRYSVSGLTFRCKECELIRSKIYKKTEDGLISVIYSNQKSNARKREMELPNYTKLELKEWLYSNGFKLIYDSWKKSNYNTRLVPSCDRIDDYKSYTLENIRIVTWDENNRRYYSDAMSGKNTKNTKSIIGINNISGDQKRFYSLSQASRELNINRCGISNNLIGKTNSSGGYSWNYENQK